MAASWKNELMRNHPNLLSSNVTYNFPEQNEFYVMLVSVGMGLGFGLIAGLLTYITNPLLRSEYFEDGYYWRMQDGIRTVYTGPVKSHAPVR